MNKNLLWLLIVILTFGLLILTNPKTDEHKEAVKEKAASMVDQALTIIADSTSSMELHDQLNGEEGTRLRKTIVDDLLEQGISRSNYLLFSTTNLNYKGQKATVGYGLLTKVFLNSNFDKAIRGSMIEPKK